MPESLLKEADWWILAAFVAGALTFFVGDWLIDQRGGRHRKRIASGANGSEDGSGMAIFLGTLLDGIPESLVLGLGLGMGNSVSVAFLAAVFVSNIPEGIAGTSSLISEGHSRRQVYRMWIGLVIASAAAAAVGYSFARSAPSIDGRVVQSFAAGAMLTMLADTMMPEAFKHGANRGTVDRARFPDGRGPGSPGVAGPHPSVSISLSRITMTPPYPKVHVIINPASGPNRPILNTLNDVFRKHGVDWDVSITKRYGDATEQAKDAIARGVDLVVGYGGDGTQHELANAVIGTGMPMGILPGGTGRVCPRDRIPKELGEAVELLCTSQTVRPFDAVLVGNEYFIQRLYAGIPPESQTSRDLKERYGLLAYASRCPNRFSGRPSPSIG